MDSRSSGRRLRQRFAGDGLYEDLVAFAQAASPHQAITPERKLARQYGISVNTVRRTLDRLVEEGVIYKRDRLGNFVSESARQAPIQKLRTLVYVECWGPEPRPLTSRLMQGLAQQTREANLRLQLIHAASGEAFIEDDHVFEVLADPTVAVAAVPWVFTPWIKRLRAVRPDLPIICVGSGHEMLDEKITSVLPDYRMVGHRAAAYLNYRKCQHVHICHQHPAVWHGAIELFERISHTQVTEWRRSPDRLEVQRIVAGLADGEVDGLIFSDDRLAAAVLEKLGEKGRKLIADHRVVSHANVGEPVLPDDVVKLEFDFREIGQVTAQVAAQLAAGRLEHVATVLVEPHVVMPAKRD